MEEGKWKMEKSPASAMAPKPNSFPSSLFPIPYSISLVSDLLAVSQVADGVVRLADLRRLLLNDRACARVERGLFQRILVSSLGDIFAAFGFRNDRVVI